MVLKTVKAIENEAYKLTAQDENQELKHAPKLFKENTELQWDEPAEKLYNYIKRIKSISDSLGCFEWKKNIKSIKAQLLILIQKVK